MKTKIELEQNIISLTATIHQKFPELSKYIMEMPENNAESEKIDLKNLKDYYQSLEELVNRYSKTHTARIVKENRVPKLFEGYPIYPPGEDIYQQHKEEIELDPEDVSKNKTSNGKENSWNEKDFNEDMSGDDLDIPGSELDDEQESVGSEDEENNYYSLGGDNHNDLEEDRG
ncbi:MAG: hypothetical protein ABIP95_06410 [Pelobium sp.]